MSRAQCALLNLITLLTACSQEETSQPITNVAADNVPSVSASPLNTDPLAQAPVDAWLTNGGSYSNQRWSPLDEINRESVSQLQAEWRVHLNGSGLETRYSAEGTPLYKDGVLYMTTGDSDAFAVDVDSGELMWEHNSQFPEEMGEAVCCGWDNRGVALGDGKVFLGQLDARLIALDEDTGEVIWETQSVRWQDGYSITGAPLFYDGMVITGYSGAEKGVRGLVEAFDADTGEKIWTFYTIPGPGDFGHDTWPQDTMAYEFGGGTVWQTPALDPELGLLYFSTGNPGPDVNGAVREGDNLFTASIVAIDVRTGEYRWHFQQVHHDIWDYDAPNPVILFDMDYQGEVRKAVAEAGKTGWVYILDRITGEPIIGVEEKPVPQIAEQFTSPTQPYPIGEAFIPQFIDIAPEGTQLVNQGRIFTPFLYEPVLVSPGLAGGANWAPSAYDPERQTMYICSSDSSAVLNMEDTELPEEHGGASWIGGNFGGSTRQNSGIVAAMDMTTNTKVWQYRWQEQCYSGFLATAGDLLFVGRNDGRLTALDTDTGMELWGFQTGAGMNAPAISFERDGKQYIAAFSGGNLFQGSPRGDSLWLFSLEGQMEETTPGDTLPIVASVTGIDPGQFTVADGEPDYLAGETLYKQTCLPCHGDDGLGGHNNAMPLNNLSAIGEVITIVSTGRNAMPTFTGALSPEQIRDVSGYVVDRLFQ
ncbi:MAG: PQQ-binding-like beta-propeller repeat protein [Gammaproteobacteria bacterium]|nr:PQQ-binding-like beta-propeller repeat protein [Gammaproteobacteria bacterium]